MRVEKKNETKNRALMIQLSETQGSEVAWGTEGSGGSSIHVQSLYSWITNNEYQQVTTHVYELLNHYNV